MLQGPRAAHEEELDALIGLATDAFNPDGVPAGNPDMGAAFPTLFCRDNLSNLRIVTDEGRPVSMAGFTVREVSVQGARIRVACVGAVCTLASHRGRGIAAGIMEDVAAEAGARGAVMLLISGGRGLYRRMGCIDAGMWQVVRADRRSRLPALECEVREWTSEDVPAMAELHRAEPIRFLRDAAEMRTLLQARSLFSWPARAWVVTERGRAAAYLCTTRLDDETGPAGLKALEIAGARAAVLAAVPTILRATREERIDIETTWADSEMRCLASLYGLATETRGMHGTLKIIDPRGLLEALETRFPERLEPADLAALLFGSVERTRFTAGSGRLGALQARLFPLALPGYGLNYI